MMMRAAVLKGPENIEIEDVEIENPRDNEVLVKIEYAGVCASDLDPFLHPLPETLPMVLGHEGSGVVEKVGENVRNLTPGDKVILFAWSSCGKCYHCNQGKEYVCTRAMRSAFSGEMLDGTKRIRSKNGLSIGSFFSQGSFAEKAIVNERAVVRVNEKAPLSILSPLGCGFSTGIGAVFNVAKVEPGSTVAVFGCGGVGLSAIAAASSIGTEIIAVDINDDALKKAEKVGAEHTVNPNESDPVKYIRDLTKEKKGADYSFDFVGLPKTLNQALKSTTFGGSVVLTGVSPPGTKAELDMISILWGRKIIGNVEGYVRPKIDIPRYVDMYMRGVLNLDPIVAKVYSDLNDVKKALEAIKNNKVVGKQVIKIA